MLPHLHQLADAYGFVGSDESAFVFLGLLRLKPYDNLREFEDWVHRVTRYPRYEIKAYVKRAKKGSLIVNGQPNEAALCETDGEDEAGFVTLALMIHLLQGKFSRTVESEFCLPERME